jgi:hypothetical protein
MCVVWGDVLCCVVGCVRFGVCARVVVLRPSTAFYSLLQPN